MSIKKDEEISAKLRKLERPQRASLLGHLADLKPIMAKLTKEEQATLQYSLEKMQREEERLIFEIFESDYLQSHRFADIIGME